MFKFYLLLSFVLLLKDVNAQGLQVCTCVNRNNCYQNFTSGNGGNGGNNGMGQIDVRIVNNDGPAPPPITSTCSPGTETCCSGPGVTGCGLRWRIPPTPTTTPAAGQAPYGSQPWIAAILDTNNLYLGCGVLITPTSILTAAHKIMNRLPSSIQIRMGEWNSNQDNEPYPIQRSLVSQIKIHEGFILPSLTNDVAILRLVTPIQLGPSPNPAINTGCLPSASTNVDNMRCIVSGWGKDAFTGTYQSTLKEVEVPIVPSNICAAQLKSTTLGPAFNFDANNFICAGGEVGRDACLGDGGAGLMCNIGGRYQVFGLVAWGIGCAQANVPGVYVRVQSFLPWITRNLT